MNGNKRYNEGDSMQKTKTRKQSRISSAKAGRSIQHARADYYDYSLVAVIVLLICFGLVMLYSTSSYMAEVKYGNDMFYFKKQAAISVACIVMALIISRIDYHILYYFTTILYVAAFGLMLLVKTLLWEPLPMVPRGGCRSDRSSFSHQRLQKWQSSCVCPT